MTIERRTIIKHIEVPISGGVGVLIELQLVEGGVVLSAKNHRTIIPADMSPAEQMAYVNDHLRASGESPISSADIQRLGMFHRLSTELPSENAPNTGIEEKVAEIKEAKESTKVVAK